MTTSAADVSARLQAARARLHAADPVIAGLIDRRPDYDPRFRLDGITTFVVSVSVPRDQGHVMLLYLHTDSDQPRRVADLCLRDRRGFWDYSGSPGDSSGA